MEGSVTRGWQLRRVGLGTNRLNQRHRYIAVEGTGSSVHTQQLSAASRNIAAEYVLIVTLVMVAFVGCLGSAATFRLALGASFATATAFRFFVLFTG